MGGWDSLLQENALWDSPRMIGSPKSTRGKVGNELIEECDEGKRDGMGRNGRYPTLAFTELSALHHFVYQRIIPILHFCFAIQTLYHLHVTLDAAIEM